MSDFPLLSGGCVLSGLQLLHQFRRIVQNNERRARAQELYIGIPEGFSLCDLGDEVRTVWSADKLGVAPVFERLAKKTRECQKLVAAEQDIPCLICKPLQCYDMSMASSLTREAKRDFREVLELLSRRDAGKKQQRSALRLLHRLLATCPLQGEDGCSDDIFVAIASLAREPAHIAQELVQALREVSAKSLVSQAAPLEEDLQHFVD